MNKSMRQEGHPKKYALTDPREAPCFQRSILVQRQFPAYVDLQSLQSSDSSDVDVFADKGSYYWYKTFSVARSFLLVDYNDYISLEIHKHVQAYSECGTVF